MLMNELEQDNPSLFILLHQMLYRYLYVQYPILPAEEDVHFIGEAIKEIGKELLIEENHDEMCTSTMAFIDEIKMCEALYLSVIEE